jgi:hypothetical protein
VQQRVKLLRKCRFLDTTADSRQVVRTHSMTFPPEAIDEIFQMHGELMN